MIDIDRLSSGFVTWMSGQNFQNPYSPATIRIYGHTVRRFLEYSGSDGILDISEAGIHIVRKFVTNGINGTISQKSTQTVRISAMVLFFDYLESDGAVLMNQARIFLDDQKRKRGGQGGKPATRLKSVLEWDEIDRLAFEAGRLGTIAGIRDAALVGLILDTGLRASEVCALTTANGEGYLTGRLRVIGKGNKERLVRFEASHASRMQSWFRMRHRIRAPNERLFVTDQGNPLTIGVLYMIVKRLLERTGIKKAQQGPHLLRHTAASIWLANGVELKQVQENLGHSNIGTTSRYLHLLAK